MYFGWKKISVIFTKEKRGKITMLIFLTLLLEFQLSLHSNSEAASPERMRNRFSGGRLQSVSSSADFFRSQLKLFFSHQQQGPPPRRYFFEQRTTAQNWISRWRKKKQFHEKMVFESAHYKRQEDDEESVERPASGRQQQQVPEVKMAMVRIHSTDVCENTELQKYTQSLLVTDTLWLIVKQCIFLLLLSVFRFWFFLRNLEHNHLLRF